MSNDSYLRRRRRRRWFWLGGVVLALIVAAVGYDVAVRYQMIALPGMGSVPPVIERPHTFMISGQVTESAPTINVGLPGVDLKVRQNGKVIATTRSGAGGSYYLQGLAGEMTVNLSRPGYISATHQVMMFSDQNENFQLTPEPSTISQTIQGEAKPTDPRCYLIHGCQVYTINAHHDGPLDAKLTWPNNKVYLMLQLYDPDTGHILAEGQNLFVVEQQVHSDLTAGTRYRLRVVYENGSEPTPFTLAMTHPN